MVSRRPDESLPFPHGQRRTAAFSPPSESFWADEGAQLTDLKEVAP